jgi:hypothetical protein
MAETVGQVDNLQRVGNPLFGRFPTSREAPINNRRQDAIQDAILSHSATERQPKGTTRGQMPAKTPTPRKQPSASQTTKNDGLPHRAGACATKIVAAREESGEL